MRRKIISHFELHLMKGMSRLSAEQQFPQELTSTRIVKLSHDLAKAGSTSFFLADALNHLVHFFLPI